MLQNIKNAKPYQKVTLKRTKSSKSLHSARSRTTIKTVECGVGASPPTHRKTPVSVFGAELDIHRPNILRNVSADSGIGGISGQGQWNVPYGMSHVNMHAYNTVAPIYSVSQHGAFNQSFLPMVYQNDPYRQGYTDIEIKSYRSDATSNRDLTANYDSIQLGTNTMDKIDELEHQNFDCDHPDTQAKLNEISKKIKSRSNSRAPSLAAQSRASSKSKLNVSDSISGSEEKSALNGIKPDDTDAERIKTDPKKTYGKLETDDELEARKAWHESRFIKNAKMQKISKQNLTPKQRFRGQKGSDGKPRNESPIEADVETDNYIDSKTNLMKKKSASPTILKTSIQSVGKELVPFWEASVKSESQARQRSLSTDYALNGKPTSFTVRDKSTSSNEFEDIDYKKKVVEVPYPIERTRPRNLPLLEPSSEAMDKILNDAVTQAFSPPTPIFQRLPSPPCDSPNLSRNPSLCLGNFCKYINF